MSRKRFASYAFLATFLFVSVASFFVYSLVGGSRPVTDGDYIVAGIGSDIEVHRDDIGVPIIKSESRRDGAFGTGFVHAQERFFQMDLSRRIAAGELSALFGSNTLEIDRVLRIHRMRTTALRAVENLEREERALLDAYVDGVNAGLRRLNGKPIEYQITRTTPREWAPEDSFLVVLSMFLMLQDADGSQEYARHALHAKLDQPMASFFAALGTAKWDAPLRGEAIEVPSVPGAQNASPLFSYSDEQLWRAPDVSLAGSNAWAVSGDHTDDGRALVANDIHLAFSNPSTFFRLQLETGPPDDTRRVVGISLPGAPFIVAGSNGAVAWGLSNSAGDWSDLIRLKLASATDGTKDYLSSGGRQALTTVREVIEVKNSESVEIEIPLTMWGPLIDIEGSSDTFALQWVAHSPDAVNLNFLDIENAASVSEAVKIGPTIGIPAMNLVVGDADGNIGWTIAGKIPLRSGSDGYLPVESSDPGVGWKGWLAPDEYPSVTNPESGRIWTANARLVDGDDLRKIGHGYYILGARASQIRDRLFQLGNSNEKQHVEIQLDDRALFHSRWRNLATQLLARNVTLNSDFQSVRAQLEAWDGRASRGSKEYLLVRDFRRHVEHAVFSPLIEFVRQEFPGFDINQIGDQQEGPLWRLVSEKPVHFLPQSYSSWDDLLVSALKKSLGDNATSETLDRSWGSTNRLQMRHPMSAFVPLLGILYDFPEAELAGDRYMPLAQTPDFGPVHRMVVRPGREEDGLFSMSGGQASNPMADYYSKGHKLWLEGRSMPLLSGDTRYSLRLVPALVAQDAG